MFYSNGEPELFPPPQKDFISVMEVVCNLKDPNQTTPSLQGQLKLSVQFDRETKETKTQEFEEEIYKTILGIEKGTKEENQNRYFDQS